MTEDDERTAIECKLQQLRFVQPFPTAEGVAAHNERLEWLTKRLQALPPRPEPIIGQRAGSIVVGADRLLGSIPPPDSGPAEDRGHHSVSLEGSGLHPWADDE